MSEENKTRRELPLKDFEADFEKYFQYEKSPLWKKFEDYQKNLLCIRDVADGLLGHMKGHGVSFKPEITDEKGKFSQEKLSGFVDELLARWAEKQREGTFTDLSTGESMAESYIRARQELYGSYLYLIMRCSLSQADYDFVVGGSLKVRTDFAFLLEQAEWLMRGWCVVKEEDGSKKNQLFWGYDGKFGLHLYRVLSCPAAGHDNGFDLVGRLPVDASSSLTDEGNVKRNQFKRIYVGRRPWSLAEKVEETPPEDMTGDICGDEDGYNTEDSYGEEDDYDMEYSPYDADDYDDDDWERPEYDDGWYEERERQAEKQLYIENLPLYFEHKDEYVEKCRRFVELFQQAGQDVLREFCRDLEEIVALYLAE